MVLNVWTKLGLVAGAVGCYVAAAYLPEHAVSLVAAGGGLLAAAGLGHQAKR